MMPTSRVVSFSSSSIPFYRALQSNAPVPVSSSDKDEHVVLVPAYFFPYDNNDAGIHDVGPYWSNLIETAKVHKERLVVIANPHNGPGSGQGWENQKYNEAIYKVQQAGAIVIGYVHACYGLQHNSANCNGRTLAQIHQEISNWKIWYNVDGIFVDEVATSPEKHSWFSDLIQYIETQFSAEVITYFNYGTVPNSMYNDLPVIHGLCENTESAFDGVYSNLNASEVRKNSTVLLHHVNSGNVERRKNEILALGARGLYVTGDGSDGNPWDSLPSYFSSLF